MRVDLDPGFVTILGIDLRRTGAIAAGAEELAIRRCAGAVAPVTGERQAVMLSHDLGQSSFVVFGRYVPVLRPCELGVGHALAGIGHAFDPEVCAVGENGCEHCVGFIVLLA